MPTGEDRPNSRELSQLIRGRIEGGEFPPGATLPPITDLMEEYGSTR
jgi:GntR family transcriptional regulator